MQPCLQHWRRKARIKTKKTMRLPPLQRRQAPDYCKINLLGYLVCVVCNDKKCMWEAYSEKY